MKTKSIAKTIVLNPAGQVLLMRRSRTDDRRPGEWDFPGGGVDGQEDFAAAAARELSEEAGIVGEPAELKLVYTATEPWEPTDESINRFLFALHVPADTAVTLSFEHDEYKWIDVDTALQDFPHTFYGKGLAYARDHGLL